MVRIFATCAGGVAAFYGGILMGIAASSATYQNIAPPGMKWFDWLFWCGLAVLIIGAASFLVWPWKGETYKGGPRFWPRPSEDRRRGVK